MMKKTILSVFVAAIATGAILAVFCLVQFNGNAVREPSELYVSSRSSYGELIDSLAPRIRHRAAFRIYARRLDLENTFEPGHYELKPGMSVIRIVRMLKLGLQTPVRVTDRKSVV